VESFLKIVVSQRSKYEIINFGRNVILEIEKKVIQYLKLNSMNELRDKFEGQAFYNNYSTILLGEMAVKKKLGLNFLENGVKPNNKEAILILNGNEILIITSHYGEFPYINENEKRSVIFTIRKNDLSIWICGLATIDILEENKLNKSQSNESAQKGKLPFDLFEKLIPISDIENLNLILEKK
jgi:hypothetical protein